MYNKSEPPDKYQISDEEGKLKIQHTMVPDLVKMRVGKSVICRVTDLFTRELCLTTH